MKWLSDSDVLSFLSERNYDVRQTKNARWIDQKCAADVITIVADCIIQYADSHFGESFTADDVWHSEYAVTNVADIFKKPSPNETKAVAEYNKFFMQPMEMFAYSGILARTKQGKQNRYTIIDRSLLEYLSIRERNALTFLQMYITKVLTDSGLMSLFDDFLDKQTKASYDAVKDGFTNFTICHTKINGIIECRRIFIKVINPLAFQRNRRGTENGRLSAGIVTYDMLMYNRDNFRDIYADKPKELTRRQYIERMRFSPSSEYKAYLSQKAKRYNAYLSQKAKRLVRAFNDKFRNGRSEVDNIRHSEDQAINIHHIFPEAEFPEICAYYENLIALTPTQHYSYAHPQGNTHSVDTAYQHTCLIAKTAVIRETMDDQTCDQIYEFERFMYVLFVGLDNDGFIQITDKDFDGVVAAINLAYA